MVFPSSIPVFVDTSLGTHLAVPVRPDITVDELKTILERDHFSCFPELGEIKVTSLMVNRRSCFYHLSDVMPLKVVFMGSAPTWFLRMDAFQLMCMYREETIVHSLEKLSSMQISNDHRPGKLNPSTSLVSQKLKSSRRLKLNNDRPEHDTMQCNQNQETGDSISDISDITICSKSVSNIGSGDLNAQCKAASSRRNYFRCKTEKNVLPLPSFSVKENSKKATVEQVCRKNTSAESLKDLMEENPASSKAKYVTEVTSASLLDRKTQTQLSISMDMPSNVHQHDDNILPEHTLKSKKAKHISSYATSTTSFSGKVSVTGLITRYFADYDEVNSSYNFPKDIEERVIFTHHFNLLNHEQIPQDGISDSALQGFSKRIAITGSHNDCSFNIESSEKRLSEYNNLLNVNNLERGNHEVVSFSCRNEVTGTNNKTEKTTILLISDENSSCQVDTETLYRERASRSERKDGRKLLYGTAPRSRKMPIPSVNKHREGKKVSRKLLYGTTSSKSRRISAPSSANKRLEASSSKCDKIEVGKRLLQAAKSMFCSTRRKKSLNSTFISRYQCPLTPEGTEPMKKFSFEVDSEMCLK